MRIISLKNQSEFDYINAKGRRLFRMNFTVVIMQAYARSCGRCQGALHLGMKVSKKLGGATVRNLIKRRVRCIIRALLKINEQSMQGIGVLIIPKKSASTQKFIDLFNELSSIL